MDEIVNLLLLLQEEIHTIHILVGITFVIFVGVVSGILTHMICKMIIVSHKTKNDKK